VLKISDEMLLPIEQDDHRSGKDYTMKFYLEDFVRSKKVLQSERIETMKNEERSKELD
jgi:hypothetical protein